jgi:hypothetical protein
MREPSPDESLPAGATKTPYASVMTHGSVEGASESERHALLHKWVPLIGHDGTHFIPSHVTLPPVGPAHGVQLGPHALVSFAAHRPFGHVRVPWLHIEVHMLFMHLGVACGSCVVHTLLHVLQFIGSLVVSTHIFPHCVVFPEQLVVHEYEPAEDVHRGVLVPHAAPHAPQLLVVSMAVSHPWSGPPSAQCA